MHLLLQVTRGAPNGPQLGDVLWVNIARYCGHLRFGWQTRRLSCVVGYSQIRLEDIPSSSVLQSEERQKYLH